jgi:hypothetical protein
MPCQYLRLDREFRLRTTACIHLCTEDYVGLVRSNIFILLQNYCWPIELLSHYSWLISNDTLVNQIWLSEFLTILALWMCWQLIWVTYFFCPQCCVWVCPHSLCGVPHTWEPAGVAGLNKSLAWELKAQWFAGFPPRFHFGNWLNAHIWWRIGMYLILKESSIIFNASFPPYFAWILIVLLSL